MNSLAVGRICGRTPGHDQAGKAPNSALHQHITANLTSVQDLRTRFSNLVLPHLDDAYTLARWLIGGGADSEDVVQDACLRAFRSIGSFGNDNARARILTIVRQSAYTWLDQNRPPAPVNVEDDEPIESAQSVSESSGVQDRVAVSIAQTDTACLKAAIAALASPFREVVVLHDIQGLPYREIADVIDVPIGTVMSRLARGRGLVIAAIGC